MLGSPAERAARGGVNITPLLAQKKTKGRRNTRKAAIESSLREGSDECLIYFKKVKYEVKVSLKVKT